jgi:hypothetical protein
MGKMSNGKKLIVHVTQVFEITTDKHAFCHQITFFV